MTEVMTQQYSLSVVYQDKFSYPAEDVYLEETTSAGKSVVFYSGDWCTWHSQNTHTGFNIQIRNSSFLQKDATTEILLKESEFYIGFNCMTDLMLD